MYLNFFVKQDDGLRTNKENPENYIRPLLQLYLPQYNFYKNRHEVNYEF